MQQSHLAVCGVTMLNLFKYSHDKSKLSGGDDDDDDDDDEGKGATGST